MKPYVFAILFSFSFFQSFSQSEMETECIKKIKNLSVNTDFPRYMGKTTVSNDTIRFEKSSLIIIETDAEIFKIFELGIISPDLIVGTSTSGDSFQQPKESIAVELRISNVEEIHFANQKPSTKLFSFLLWRKNIANPSLYLFELTQENSESSIRFLDFIEKAKVTAFGFCSILI